MDYRRHAPATELLPYVEHYWTVVSPAPDSPLRSVLVPSGRAAVQFCLGTPGSRLMADGTARRNADVYLPIGVDPLVIEQDGPAHYVGIQFTPWGARSLFPDTPTEPAQVTDTIGPLPDKSELAIEPVGVLDAWVGAFVPRHPPATELLASATARIDRDPSTVVVGELCSALGVSPSTLYRAFRDGIGLAPKQYIRIMRFRAFTDAVLSETAGQPAALLAALAGYADQSHASRDFTRFTGMTASAFRDAYDGIARLMARP